MSGDNISLPVARPTILDVASRAGCSKSTVSRFLNGSELIAAATRARIAEAIAQLGFRPSEIGRSLQRQLAPTIGVIVPSLTNPVFASTLAGIQERARARGLSVILATSDYHPETEIVAVETLLAHRVSGLVLTICDAEKSKILELIDREQRPHVFVFNQPRSPTRVAVSVDNAGFARKITQEMIALGHRQVAFLAGHFSASDRSRLRYSGYCEALKAANCEPLPPLEVDFVGADAAQRLAQPFRSPNPPTALLCSTDILALAAISTLRDLELRVPDDVSVAGFDGIAIGGMISPALATVMQPTREMGQLAMDLLLRQIAGDTVKAPPLFDCQIRLGGTLARAPLRVRALSA